MKKLKVGVIGLGARGYSLLTAVLLPLSKIQITAVCDTYPDRTKKAADTVREAYRESPFETEDYREVLARGDVDAVIIASAWESHVRIAVDAMKAGKAVGLEVGGAYSIEDCWRMVHTYEETGTLFMFLENCCYGRRELMVLNMAEQGVFGEIVHCMGGYHHDLRQEIGFGEENRHYRLRNYIGRNCENYPTHELGPIAKVLHINRGNRMLSLTSTASKAAGMRDYLLTDKPDDQKLAGTRFGQGDIVTTVIKCARGETITLVLDTTLPRYYCRNFTVRGTKGMYEEVTDSIFLDPEDRKHDFHWKPQWGNAAQYEKEYESPIWKRYLEEGITGGHDGMDYLVLNAFFDSVLAGTPCPIDVYDAAAWMSISALSERSIALGSMPVEIPDFTNGEWMKKS